MGLPYLRDRGTNRMLEGPQGAAAPLEPLFWGPGKGVGMMSTTVSHSGVDTDVCCSGEIMVLLILDDSVEP